jgi:ADP-L-glycero-D-manno-heptose 6-epimerase
MENLKILITGATGFIGYNLSKKLKELGHELILVGQRKECDIDVNYWSFEELIKQNLKVDACFHQAALNDTLETNKELMMLVNYHYSKQLFKNLFKNGCEKFIFASSTAIYGNSPAPYIEKYTKVAPLNCYGESKAKFESWALAFGQRYNISTIGLRYCNVYGPNEGHKQKRASMIYQIYQKIKNKEEIKLFKFGEQKRDYIYIDDVVQCNLNALASNTIGAFNCGGGNAYSFNQILNAYNNALKLSIEPTYIDCPFADKYQNFTLCDMSYTEKHLKFKPSCDLATGVADIIKKAA